MTTTITRAAKIAAIKLRDSHFDPTNRSDEYLTGRFEASVEAQPLVGVPKDRPVLNLDEKDLSPVTKAMIRAENERDRARVAASTTTTTTTNRADAADTEGLSDVTKAMIRAHDLAEARRNGGFDGNGGDAA